MALVDTSVIVAKLNERDELHAKAEAVKLDGGTINAIVYSEVANVLQKKIRDKDQVVKALDLLLDCMQVAAVTSQELQESTRVYESNYPRLSLADSVLVAQSLLLGQELITFDEDQAKATKH